MSGVKQNVASGPVNSVWVIIAFFKRRESAPHRRGTGVTLPYSYHRLAATLIAVVAAGLK